MTNDPMPTSPPPGKPGYYYPDKGGGAMKWWDGVGWTEYAPTQQLPPQPVQPPPQPQPEPKKKSWLRWLPLTAVALLASCGALMTLGDSETTTTPPVASSSDFDDDSDSPEPEPEPEPTQETVGVGEKVRDDGYQFVVTNVRCGINRVGSQYFGEKAQGQFCLVKMRIKNVSKKPIYFSDENQTLVDRKGRDYSADDGAWAHVGDGELPFGEINPGNTLKVTVPFDIPRKAKPDRMLLKAGVWGASEGVVVKLS
jgi:hypothetical protein